MGWKKRMSQAVREMEFAEYGSFFEDRPVIVDCALGTNPLGSPESVAEGLAQASCWDVGLYPGDDLPLRRLLADYWGRFFSPEEVVLGTGSIGLLVAMARTFCAPGASVLGVSPQFPDGPMHFQFSGAAYRPLSLVPPDYRLHLSRLREALTGEESLVYLDRPHNPTGQVPPLAEVQTLAEACETTGSLLVVDEAYGDYLPPQESALNLRHASLIVLRSFSKGWGLAGIRAGYAVIRDDEARRFMKKTMPPFSLNAVAMRLLATVLKDDAFLLRSREAVKAVKAPLLASIEATPRFSVAATHAEVPIFLLSSHIDGDNLYDRLMSEGIRTEAGTCFDGLGAQSVRVRVPAPDQVDLFLERWHGAVRS
jgi:histidinol-phosphate aminotransferase